MNKDNLGQVCADVQAASLCQRDETQQPQPATRLQMTDTRRVAQNSALVQTLAHSARDSRRERTAERCHYMSQSKTFALFVLSKSSLAPWRLLSEHFFRASTAHSAELRDKIKYCKIL
jgi:hypothetical protein